MNALIPQPLYQACTNCDSSGEFTAKPCANCTRPQTSERQTRMLGALMIALSLILIVGMGYVIYSVDRSITLSGKPGSTTKWTATPTEISLMFGVLYTVLATGISAFIAGLWHLVIGRRNLTLIWTMFALTIVLFVFANYLPQ